ncbi:MAG: phosphate acyltransferase PlsX [Longimicrobiales bacterium]|nr:phosphate acyltransferase PlsX [Longimicrobiales bacterium]
MRIALDASGTDDAPEIEIDGALAALRDLDGIAITLVGDEALIRAALAARGVEPSADLSIVHAPDQIHASDSPSTVVRRKPDSAIVRGIDLHRSGEVDAFISAGNTGAVMAASLFMLRPLPGVERPSVATMLPTVGAPVILIDAGTNVDCKPKHLVQFAYLGSVYARDALGVTGRPRVGLLNIGEEPEKGDERAIETHRLLAEDPGVNFIGNVEGRDVIRGVCDVLVADGFAGNVLLKFYESVAQYVVGIVKRELDSHDVDLDYERVFRVLDYSEYGGAPLLGVNGLSIICHGGSSPKAIRNAIRVAADAVRNHLVGDMAAEFADRAPGHGSQGGTPS